MRSIRNAAIVLFSAFLVACALLSSAPATHAAARHVQHVQTDPPDGAGISCAYATNPKDLGGGNFGQQVGVDCGGSTGVVIYTIDVNPLSQHAALVNGHAGTWYTVNYFGQCAYYNTTYASPCHTTWDITSGQSGYFTRACLTFTVIYTDPLGDAGSDDGYDEYYPSQVCGTYIYVA